MADDETRIFLKGDPQGLINAFNAGAARAKKFESETKSVVAGIHSEFRNLYTMLAGYIGFDQLKTLAANALEAMDNISKLEQKTGIGAETLQVYSYAAKLADTDINSITKGLGIFAKNLFSAEEKGKDATSALQNLGISMKDSQGHTKGLDTLLEEVADKFANMKDGTEKTALTMQLFGKGGKDLIPILNEGSEGIRKYEKELKSYGLLLDEETIRKGEELNDNLKRIQIAGTGLSTNVMVKLTPSLNALAEAFLDTKTGGNQVKDVAEGIACVLKGVGVVALGVAAAFDITGTAIGNFIGWTRTAGIQTTNSLDDLGVSIEDLGIKATKLAAVKNPSLLDGMEGKLQKWSNMINGFWDGTDKSAAKRSKKRGGEIDVIQKGTADKIGDINKKIEEDTLKLTLSEIEQYRRQAEEWELQGANKEKVSEWLTSKISSYNQKIMDDAEKITLNEMDQAERQAEIWAKAGADKEAVAKWLDAKTTSIWEKGQDEYEKIMSEEAEFGMSIKEHEINKILAKEEERINRIEKLLHEEKIDEEQAATAISRIKTNALHATSEKEIEWDKKVADTKYELIKDIAGYETEAYGHRLKQIEAEKNKRIKDAGSTSEAIALAAKWEVNEQKKAYIAMGKAGDDWKAGILAGLTETTMAHTTWGNTAYAVTQAFTSNSSQQLQTNLFQVWKGNIKDINIDWQSMLDNIGGALTKKISDMAVEAAANKIIMYFKSSWTETGSNVLNVVSKVLGLGDLFSSSESGTGGVAASTYIFEGAEDFGGSFAYGGWVPGIAARPGNSYANDTIRAFLSPDEYVIDRETTDAIARQGQRGDTILAHINKAEAELLIRLGGAGTINPKTGLLEFYTAGRFERIQSDLGDWRYVAPNYQDVGYQEFFSPPDPMNGAVADWTQARLLSDGRYFTGGADTYWIMDPATGTITRQSQEGANGSGGFLSQIAPFISPLASIAMAPFTGGMSLANLMLITGGGTFAGNVLGQALFQGDVDFQKALLQGGMSAASAGIGRIASGFINGSSWESILDGSISGKSWLEAAGGAAKNQILKLAINEALNAASGGSASPNGHREVSYAGADDNGLLKSLAKMMKSMESEEEFPVPIMKAHKGYFPRFAGTGSAAPLLASNEMPVIIEDDETIIPSGQMGSVVKKLNQIISLSAGQGGNNEVLYQIAKNTAKMAKILERFDDYGMPPERKLV